MTTIDGLDTRPLVDRTAGAGLLLAAWAAGRSYQPGLLTRATMNQAVITGVTAATAYAWGTASHSVLSAFARRIAGGRATATSMIAVDTAAAVAAGGAAVALRWREHENGKRALGRLAAGATAASAIAGVGAVGVATTNPTRANRALLLAAAAAGGLSWLATRPWRQRPGSMLAPDKFYEDRVREVSPLKATGIGVGVLGFTYGLAAAETAISHTVARGAAALVGGEASDHRSLGRIGAAAITFGTGWLILSAVTSKLDEGGDGMEPGHLTPPEAAEVTGSPASGVAWGTLTREGRRWLSMALTPAGIDAVMGTTNAKQPIRVYSSTGESDDEVDRVELLLAEIDRTHALERKYFALFSPTGSGYVNYVANETLEYLSGGDCASAAIQYSVLPSSLSLTKVAAGTAQTRMVLEGIMQRIRAMAPESRPVFLLFGESLGSQVSEEMFRDTYTYGLQGSGIDSAIWIGTPAATEWYQQIWGERTITEVPELGPKVGDRSLYLPRAIHDWHDLPDDQKEQVGYLLLQNGDDPIPKFAAPLIWRRPAWLCPPDQRPPGTPRNTSWMPVSTFFATFFDMMNALVPIPGTFAEGGHDYREVLPDTIRTVWDLEATSEQMERVQAALRQRELAWELHRQWTAALAKSSADTDEAQRKVLEKASGWVGRSLTAADVEQIIDRGLQPRPEPATAVGGKVQ